MCRFHLNLDRYDVSSRSGSVQLPRGSPDSRSNSIRMKNNCYSSSSVSSRNGSPDKNSSSSGFMNSNSAKNRSLLSSADLFHTNRGNSNYDRNRNTTESMNGSPDKNISPIGSADVSRSNSVRFRSKSPVIPEISTEFNSWSPPPPSHKQPTCTPTYMTHTFTKIAAKNTRTHLSLSFYYVAH